MKNDKNILTTRFSDVLDLWLMNHKFLIKKTTYDKYFNIIALHIKPNIGNISITEISIHDINYFLNDQLITGKLRHKEPLSSSYIKTMSFIIKSALNYANQENHCTLSTAKIIIPREYKKELIILSLQDQKKFEQYLSLDLNTSKLGVKLSLYLGMRIGEVCALRWEDIDFNNKTIYIRKTVSRINIYNANNPQKTSLELADVKSKNSYRLVPIPSCLLEDLIYFSKIKKSDYLISNKSNNFLDPRTFQYRFKNYLKKADIASINFHALRHTFATRCIEFGMDVKTLSEILGHSNVNITLNTYVHTSIESKRIQLEKISKNLYSDI